MYQKHTKSVTMYYTNNSITQILTSIRDALRDGPDEAIPSIVSYDDHFYLTLDKDYLDVITGILPRGVTAMYPEDTFELFGEDLVYIPLEQLRPMEPHIDEIIRQFVLFEKNAKRANNNQKVYIDRAEKYGRSICENYYYLISDIRKKVEETMV